MTDTQALQDRVAQLEAQLARLLPPVQVEPDLPHIYQQEPAAPELTDVALLAGSQGLPHDLRVLGQLSVAVSLSRGDVLPGAKIPVSYEPDVRRLAAARERGLSWRAALVECALEVPDDGDVAFRTRELRRELRGLWDALLPVLDALKARGNALQTDNLLSFLRGLVV